VKRQGDRATGRRGEKILVGLKKYDRVGARMEKIKAYKDLRVYQAAIDAAMSIFTLTKHFPPEEKYSMVDQMRRSSRSVCANIAEAWRKRRYPAHFVSKLSDSESEAEETRIWIELAHRCGYLKKERADELDDCYDKILGQLVLMIKSPEKWTI
jgi:four helix bundle protein